MSSSRRLRALLALFAALAVPARGALAQAASAPADTLLSRIRWQGGPTKTVLGGVVEVKVPPTCQLTDAAGAALFAQGAGEAAHGDEIGVMLCQSARPDSAPWYAVLRYETPGRVRDDDRDALDANRILETLREENTADTEERRKRGEPALPLVGWKVPPTYDPERHTLMWAAHYSNGNEADETVVHSVRVLGREGVLRTDFVVAPQDYVSEMKAFALLAQDMSFVEGQRYADWVEGDRVAAYGLAALAVGGTISMAKAGLFLGIWLVIRVILFKAKLFVKKIIIVAVVGLGGLISAWWKKRQAARA